MEPLASVAAVLAASHLYLVIHEGAHALSATLLGIKPSTVRIGTGPVVARPVSCFEIRALPFGGTVTFDDSTLLDRRTRVALAGAAIAAPVATLVTATLLAAVSPEARQALATASALGTDAPSTFLRSLTTLCALLGAANLLPVPPLDGGSAALLLSSARPRTIERARVAGAAALLAASAWFLARVAGIPG